MDTDVLIIGAGIAGCSLANGLRAAGVEYELVEKCETPLASGAGILLQGGALRALSALGLDAGDGVPEGHEIRCLNIGTAFNPSILKLPMVGALSRCLAMHRQDLHELLLANVDSSKLHAGVTVDRVTERRAGYVAKLSDGERISCRIIVGADGINSQTRSRLLGDPVALRDTNQVCWRFVVDGWSRDDQGYELHHGSMRMGVIPLGRGRCYIFLVRRGLSLMDAKRYQMPDIIAMFSVFGGIGERVAASLGPGAEFLLHPLVDGGIRWHNNASIGLIGDAAHPVTPNLGMGAGLALEDSAVLCKLIEKHGLEPVIFRDLCSLRNARVRKIRGASFWFGRAAHVEHRVLRYIKFGVLRWVPQGIMKIMQDGASNQFSRSLSRI